MKAAELKCFPRLGVVQGKSLWEELRHLSMEELSQHGALASTNDSEFYAMANARATSYDLQLLRTAIVEAAHDHGFPFTSRKHKQTAFDRKVAGILHQTMGIVPADAAFNDVWVFMNLRLLPDITVWRYGSWRSNELAWEVAYDRLFTMTRTTFGRLWWRAELLGVEGAQRLREDEAVQIVERPRIAGYKPLACAIAKRHIDSPEPTQKMELLRDVMKRLTRQLAVVSVFVMNDEEIDHFVHNTFLVSEELLAAGRHTVEVPERSQTIAATLP